jgi:hypothetical protein
MMQSSPANLSSDSVGSDFTNVPRNESQQTLVNRGWPVILLLVALLLSAGCGYSRAGKQSRVRVWPPNARERDTAVASFEITDEAEDGLDNPRAKIANISYKNKSSLVESRQNRQVDARVPIPNDNAIAEAARAAEAVKRAFGGGDGASSADERLSEEQRAELQRQVAAVQELAGADGAPPVSEMRDTDLADLAASERATTPVPAPPQSKIKQEMSGVDLSVTNGAATGTDVPAAMRRIPTPPTRAEVSANIDVAEYNRTSLDRVEPISSADYVSNNPPANLDSKPVGIVPTLGGEAPASGGPQQPSRFSLPTTPPVPATGVGPAISSADLPVTEVPPALETTDTTPTQPPATSNLATTANLPALPSGATESNPAAPMAKPDFIIEQNNPQPPAAPVTANGVALAAFVGPSVKELQVTDWRTSIYGSIDELDRQIAKEPDPIERNRLEASHRILHALVNNREKALQPIEGTAPESQKYWTEQSLALITMLDPLGSPQDSRRARLASRHLKQAQRQLAASSGLDVRNVTFCEQVMGFGWFKEFSSEKFKPDQEVILYAELENFAFGEMKDGFETEFQSGYQIYDASGRRVAEHEFLPVKQVCRNVQTDYFLPYRMHVPKQLTEGTYRLQLTVEDRKGNKFGESLPISFEVTTR